MSGETTTKQYPTAGVANRTAIPTSVDLGNCAALKTTESFAQAGLELGVPTWSDGADLDPACLYANLGNGKTWPLPL